MPIDRLSTVFKTASRGLSLQRRRIQAASQNIANTSTTRVEGREGPFRPRQVVARNNDEMASLRYLESELKPRITDARHFKVDELAGNRIPVDPGPEFTVEKLDNVRQAYEPDHPDADANGMVEYPDIDMVEEMTRMVSAQRLYEANLSVVEAEKEIQRRTLQI